METTNTNKTHKPFRVVYSNGHWPNERRSLESAKQLIAVFHDEAIATIQYLDGDEWRNL